MYIIYNICLYIWLIYLMLIYIYIYIYIHKMCTFYQIKYGWSAVLVRKHERVDIPGFFLAFSEFQLQSHMTIHFTKKVYLSIGVVHGWLACQCTLGPLASWGEWAGLEWFGLGQSVVCCRSFEEIRTHFNVVGDLLQCYCGLFSTVLDYSSF